MNAPQRSKLATAVRAALAKHKAIAAWQMTSVHQRGLQTYLVKSQLESERQVDGESLIATVFVKHGDLLGSANVTFAGDDMAGLERRIDEAVD